jgi:hypothetical protein
MAATNDPDATESWRRLFNGKHRFERPREGVFRDTTAEACRCGSALNLPGEQRSTRDRRSPRGSLRWRDWRHLLAENQPFSAVLHHHPANEISHHAGLRLT